MGGVLLDYVILGLLFFLIASPFMFLISIIDCFGEVRVTQIILGIHIIVFIISSWTLWFLLTNTTNG